MRVLICPNSFKGTLSAVAVAQIIGNEFKKAGHQVIMEPIADGGDGTVDALLLALGGGKKFQTVRDPLGQNIRAYYGLNKKEAYIEMAKASGLSLLSEKQRNPWLTTTYGFGQLIKNALDRRVRKIILGIGGSATNDVGIGMAQALGIKFYDQQNREIRARANIGYGASNLAQVCKIDATHLDPRILNTELLVLSDVTNPLYGKHGASFTYAGQKGASPTMMAKLEKAVRQFAKILHKHYHKNPNFPGAGAAGGLGAGLKLFLNARITSGIQGLMTILGINEKIKKVDIVIVGEGQMDWQTAFGKAPAGIALAAKKFQKPVLAIVGKIGADVEKNFQTGISQIYSCYGRDKIDFARAKKSARSNLRKLAKIAATQYNKLNPYSITLLP